MTRPHLVVDRGDGVWEPVPQQVRPPGDPEGEPITLDWPARSGRAAAWAMLLAPWLIGPLAATAAVAFLDVDAGVGSDTWALLAGAGLLLSSALLETAWLLAEAVTRLRDRSAPERVDGIVVLVATARPPHGDGSAEQQTYYLAVHDGTGPARVHRSSSGLNARVRPGDRVTLTVGPRRRRVLRVN